MGLSSTLFSCVLFGAISGPRGPFLVHRSSHSRRLRSFSTSASPLLFCSIPRRLQKKVKRETRDQHLYQRKGNLNSATSFVKNTACKVCCSLVEVEVEDSVNEEACELVNGVELTIGDGVDNIQAYLFKAVKNNNGTGVLLLSDIFGFEDSSTRDFAYRVACNGYNVLVPDLFRGDPWAKNKPKSMFEQWITRQLKRVDKDIAISAKWMVDEFMAAGISKKLGIVGFCFGGGRVIEVLAKDQGACFGTGISFYGTRIDASLASNVKVPVLFISGDNDSLCPVSLLYDMEKSIARGSNAVIFKDRGHGFAHRPESPEEDGDAEEAFSIMRNWLHDSLIVNN